VTALAGALPERVVAALLATEDSRFEEHSLGVDWRGALRAPLGVLAGEDLAGSTLEQQLAKNLYEDGAEDPVAKARSVVLAIKLDTGWGKADVLRMYLDAGYYGHGFWGIAGAAEGYFGVSPADLSWAQATVLAGLFQAPSAYDPFLHPERAAARQAHVLDRLVAVGSLTRPEADAVAEQPWGLLDG
jgi:membrane peptidoglycan carboxypeptidase